MLARWHRQSRRGRHIPCPRIQLVGIGNQAVDIQRGDGIAFHLHRAARHHQSRIGAGAARLADRLARLAQGLGGDGAGVDDHHVALAREKRAHMLALGQIHPAAQRDDLDAHP
jgi:hypothetical protein